MLSTFFQPSEVKIHLLQNVIFLHPPEGPTARPPADGAPPQTDDELVRGLIELQVPSDRHIGGIRVRLRASEMIGILDQQTNTVPVSWDERIIMDKTLEIGVPSRHAARSRSRAPASRSASRAPSRPRSPEEPRSRRSSTDSDSEDRGRAASRDTSRSRRDPSVSGLAGALAAAMRGRSHTRSASKSSRPSSPGARGRSSSRHPVQGGLFNSAPSASSATVPGRRSMSTHTPLRAEESEDRGRSHHRPSIVPEEGVPQPHHHHHLLHHPSLHESSRSPSMGLLRGSSRPPQQEDEFEAEDDEGMFVAKGVHGFEFAFILPSNCATFERSSYGRVRYTIKATAIGAGRAKSNVDAVREIFPMAVPSIESPSTAMAVMYNDLHPTVGLLSIACTSNNISVGGIFNIDVYSPNPPPDLIVYMVRVSLETQVDLYTVKKGKQSVPPIKHRLFEKGFIPHRPGDIDLPQAKERIIRWAGTDDAWSVQGIARMPDDNVIRPTTLPGSKGDIRFSHTLVVEVIHSRDPTLEGLPADSERKLKAFALRQAVVLPSCCVAYHAVTLPRYEERQEPHGKGNSYAVPAALSREESPWSIAAGPIQGTGHEYCVCGMSLADLEAKERNFLPRTPGYDVPINHLRSRGKIGEYTPVDDSAVDRNAASTSAGPSSSPGPSSGLVTGAPSSSNSCEPSPSQSRSRSRVRVTEVDKEGAPSVHVSDPSLVVRDNLDGYAHAPRLPLAPSPGGSGMTTPVRGGSRSRSRVRGYPDLAEAIPRLNDLVERPEHDHEVGLPPAYDAVVGLENEDHPRGRASARQ